MELRISNTTLTKLVELSNNNNHKAISIDINTLQATSVEDLLSYEHGTLPNVTTIPLKVHSTDEPFRVLTIFSKSITKT